MPVGILVDEDGAFTYFDAESPQDACESGRVATFGKESRPAITTAGNAVRLRALAEGTSARAGGAPPGRLLDAARRLAARRRRDRVRGAVVAHEVPVASARLREHVRHVVRAPARRGRLVLPRSRAERRAGRNSRDDLVGAGRRARSSARPSGSPAGSAARVGAVSPDLELALRLADAADAISLPRFRSGPRDRDEARPHAR